MTIKIKYWLDSGANHQSCRRGETTTDELGMTDEEWRDMSEDEREDVMRDIAWNNADWGWEEVEED